MKRKVARDLLIPYLDGELDATTAGLLETHLASDPDMQRELEQLRLLFREIERAPALEGDEAMRRSFQECLARAKDQPESSLPAAAPLIRFPSPFWLTAAAACVVAGVFLGWRLAVRDDAARRAEREQAMAEVQTLRRDVGLLRSALLGNEFATRAAGFRLQTMNLAEDLGVADPEVVDALFATLEGDPSANVRLAALAALRRYQDESEVRSRLARSLAKQTDPMVQIALIAVLVDSGSTEAREPIENLLENPLVTPVVKGTAQRGLTRL